jgi:hypothetical protein
MFLVFAIHAFYDLIFHWRVFQSSMYMQVASRHGKDLGQSRLLSSGAKRLDTKSGVIIAPPEAGLCKVAPWRLTLHHPDEGYPGRGYCNRGKIAVYAGI